MPTISTLPKEVIPYFEMASKEYQWTDDRRQLCRSLYQAIMTLPDSRPLASIMEAIQYTRHGSLKQNMQQCGLCTRLRLVWGAVK